VSTPAATPTAAAASRVEMKATTQLTVLRLQQMKTNHKKNK